MRLRSNVRTLTIRDPRLYEEPGMSSELCHMESDAVSRAVSNLLQDSEKHGLVF